MSPQFLASVVQAVKLALAAEQAPVPAVETPVSQTAVSGIPVVEPSLASAHVGVSAQNLGTQASAFLASGTGCGPLSSQAAAVQSSQGRPAFVVPSFVPTFSAANPLLVRSSLPTCSTTVCAPRSVFSTFAPSLPAPVLHQPFVVGPGFSPIPAKVVSQIVAGKFVELNDLLSSNIEQTEPEPQLLFDGRLVLMSTPKKPKRCIKDIVSWMEAFSIFSLVLTSYFPHRWKDLCIYQLLILRTYRQFNGRVWLAYDRAFREHAAATNLVDWSSIDVQLYNFHAAGASARGRSDLPAESSEPTGSNSSQIICRSWNRGRCSAPHASCRFAHRCSSCSGPHRVSACSGHAASQPKDASKRRSASPSLPRSSSKSKRL